MRRRATYNTFGESVSKALTDSQKVQNDIAEAAGKSVQYVNNTMTGRAPASPQWVDLVASTLKMSTEQRAGLHRSAARDAGYKIDLDLSPPAKKNLRP